MSSPFNKVGHVLRREGVAGIVPYLVRWIGRRLPSRRKRQIAASAEFDRKFGISTGGELKLASVHNEDVYWYEATTPYVFSSMISCLPPEIIAQAIFIDIGCGKGRALLMAAECGFREIDGMELSRDLYLAACETVGRYQAARQSSCKIRIENIDACDYRIPNRTCVLFLYNPFGKSIMRRFAALVEQSLTENPRELFIVYLNPEWRKVWDESPSFSRFAGKIWSPEWFLIYRAVKAPSVPAQLAVGGTEAATDLVRD